MRHFSLLLFTFHKRFHNHRFLSFSALSRLSFFVIIKILSLSPQHWSLCDDADVGGQISQEPLTLSPPSPSVSLPPPLLSLSCLSDCVSSLSLSTGIGLMGFYRKRALMELWPLLYHIYKALHTCSLVQNCDSALSLRV